jgi:hypothetical protein
MENKKETESDDAFYLFENKIRKMIYELIAPVNEHSKLFRLIIGYYSQVQ